GVEQPLDPLARQELAALSVELDRLLAPASLDLGQGALELGGESLVVLLPGLELGAAGFDVAREHGHGPVTLKGVPAKGKGGEWGSRHSRTWPGVPIHPGHASPLAHPEPEAAPSGQCHAQRYVRAE